jgi:hypothetical protein
MLMMMLFWLLGQFLLTLQPRSLNSFLLTMILGCPVVHAAYYYMSNMTASLI